MWLSSSFRRPPAIVDVDPKVFVYYICAALFGFQNRRMTMVFCLMQP
jgi:hypothetical protein